MGSLYLYLFVLGIVRPTDGCRQSLGIVLEALNDHENAAECLLTSLELEATSPVQAFHVIARVLP